MYFKINALCYTILSLLIVIVIDTVYAEKEKDAIT